MNKYLGFYELKSINLPTVPWERFTVDTVLDDSLLWTIRLAVEGSNDLNLPRLIGANADDALLMGKELIERYSERGLVVYYPYFIAEKSGVLEISNNRLVIEGVYKDLWNLVTEGRKDVTIIIKPGTNMEDLELLGEPSFFSEGEIAELRKNAAIIKGRFRDELYEGKSVLAEWSYAYKTDKNNDTIGPRYLVFYELRTIGT